MVPVTERRPPDYKDTFLDVNVCPIRLHTNNSGIAAKNNSGAYEGSVEDEEGGSDDGSFSFYKLYMYTGPGWLMSIAYLDPGNSKWSYI
jgi:hypothetical protein